MKVRVFIHKNLLEFLSSFVFLVFMTWLIYIAFVGSRTPIFYDVLSQVDVSSSYISRLQLLRIIFEPLIGMFLKSWNY